MSSLPKAHQAFVALTAGLFPDPEEAGITIRTIARPDAPRVALVYIADLLEPADLERLVLQPVSRGLPEVGPEGLLQQAVFPAPVMRLANESDALLKGLMAGLAALHVDGHAAVLLVGSGRAGKPQEHFGPDLGLNLAVLRRHLPDPALRSEAVTGPSGAPGRIVYLEGKARPEMVAEVRRWAQTVEQSWQKTDGWVKVTRWLRLPPMTDSDSPVETAVALHKGYVAFFDDRMSGCRLAPLTFDMLLSHPGDTSLTLPLERLVRWPRLLAAAIGLWLSAAFVAISSYHHALLPGPFLIALASTRQNAPFPIVMEILVVELIVDVVRDSAMRFGGRQLALIAFIGTLLAVTLATQGGILGAVSGVVGVTSAIVLNIVRNSIARRVIRTWRYLFILAAAGLGLYGVGLLIYAMLTYLGEEQPFGHHVWLPLEVKKA